MQRSWEGNLVLQSINHCRNYGYSTWIHLRFGMASLRIHVAISFMFFENRFCCNDTLQHKVFSIKRSLFCHGNIKWIKETVTKCRFTALLQHQLWVRFWHFKRLVFSVYWKQLHCSNFDATFTWDMAFMRQHFKCMPASLCTLMSVKIPQKYEMSKGGEQSDSINVLIS